MILLTIKSAVILHNIHVNYLKYSILTFSLPSVSKKPISQCQACFIDLIIFIHSIMYLLINLKKISACYISLGRDFIAEYSAINLIRLLPKPGTYRTTRVVDDSER